MRHRAHVPGAQSPLIAASDPKCVKCGGPTDPIQLRPWKDCLVYVKAMHYYRLHNRGCRNRLWLVCTGSPQVICRLRNPARPTSHIGCL